MFHYDSKIQLGLINLLIREMKRSLDKNPDMIRAKLRLIKDTFHLIIKNTSKKTKVVLTFKHKDMSSFRAVCYEREINTAFNLSKDYVEHETIIFTKNPTPIELLDKITPGLLRKSKYINWITDGNFAFVTATPKTPETLSENEVFAGKIIDTNVEKSNNLFHITCQIGEHDTKQTKSFILSSQQIPYINKYYTPTKSLNDQYLVINRRMEHAIFNERNFKELFKFA